MAPKKLHTMGIFGGTFDPIHFGHLRSAVEIYEQLALDEMRLIPARYPPHRTAPHVSAEHRFNMVKQALLESPLDIDDREIQREGPSYSVDTLMSLRKEFPQSALCLIVGMDAFLGLTSWYHWEKLIQLANIVVMTRKGWQLPDSGLIAKFLEDHSIGNDALSQFTHGKIVTNTISTLEISGSYIRGLLAEQRLPLFLLPEKVQNYIQEHGLYGYDKDKFASKQEKGDL